VHRAVLFDFGGVIVSGPFESFNHFERDHGLPTNFIRSINALNPHENAWAKLERSEITYSEFDDLFAVESENYGHRVAGADVLALLAGELRPDMVHALDVLKSSGYIIACLTNNVVSNRSATPTQREELLQEVLTRFDAVIESSMIGARKPEPRFYEIACETIKVQPSECVFLDDLGINLKPAAAMGMTTIKVTTSAQALDELAQVLSIDFGTPD
jgi:putative hydrolase of the HAD superfamily